MLILTNIYKIHNVLPTHLKREKLFLPILLLSDCSFSEINVSLDSTPLTLHLLIRFSSSFYFSSNSRCLFRMLALLFQTCFLKYRVFNIHLFVFKWIHVLQNE